MTTTDKAKEIRLRRWAKRLGLVLQKSRARHWHHDDQRAYRLVNFWTKFVVAGKHFDCSLETIAKVLQETEREQQEAQAQGAPAPLHD